MKRVMLGMLIGAMALLSGCAGLPSFSGGETLQTQIGREGVCASYKPVDRNLQPILGEDGKPVSVTDENGRINEAYLKALLKGEVSFDGLLDCAFQPMHSDEARLYRGHVIVSLLATYGAYNLEFGNYDERSTDALTLLGNIEQAERDLRGPSAVVKPDVKELPYQKRPPKVTRALRVLEVAVDAERPTFRRFGNTLKGIIGAFTSGGVIGAFEDAFTGALKGLEKTVILDLYGPAYYADAREDLGRFTGKDSKPDAEDWANRDQMINEACGRIAQIAGVEAHCIPQ